MKVQVGDKVSFSKAVSEAELAAFVGLSGDDYEAHTDDDFMKNTAFGQRIVHGALLVGIMSAAGTRMIRVMKARGDTTTPVALGYDRMRFTAPVFIGDTITASYSVTDVDPDKSRSVAALELVNQNGATVAVANHIMKWLAP
ncbi:MaoC/PaaZ C-terminal domain-containing protein [Pelagibacterium lentulum]|uniref:MaoC family dehydratase n=1 Tax=Pelagibacterium lentulum TaxID=2029865 RepID=A0A916VVG3_9HYPH|nr:MaoC/PaaZ C-terminal domain-containing protein [Pelagibacterium lentulum]GGA40354.1 MaoC family dehydratase [Pelagibacterium lentulum]